MADSQLSVVTGAFGFTGRYITRLLLSVGERVKTITGHPRQDEEFGDRVPAELFNFDKPEQLAESLRGAGTLYNTYWIRFEHGNMTFEQAVQNSRTLIQAARDAGIRRIVHVSIANPSLDSDLPYYRGKALVEQAIVESGLSHAILRPTVLFGSESILINNIAWFLRHVPVFGMPGDGNYKLQPAYVEEAAALAVDLGHKEENVRIDVVGPEIFTFNELLQLIADMVGGRSMIVHLPPSLAVLSAQGLGLLMGDVVLTRDEVTGLMRNLLVSNQPPTTQTKLSEWLSQHRQEVGREYFSELKKHYR